MLYEMRLPQGITYSNIVEIVNKYDVELVQTDYGPVLQGELEELEKARKDIIKHLKERIREFENRKHGR